MILWKFTLREVKSRPGRATLTLLSIVIGVAAVVAVTVGTATTNQACQEMYAAWRAGRRWKSPPKATASSTRIWSAESSKCPA